MRVPRLRPLRLTERRFPPTSCGLSPSQIASEEDLDAEDVSAVQDLANRAQDRIVDQVLLQSIAGQWGWGASEKDLGQFLVDQEAFQVDGRFDDDTYRAFGARLGLTSDEFTQSIRRQLDVSEFARVVQGVVFIDEEELGNFARLNSHKRNFWFWEKNAVDLDIESLEYDKSEEAIQVFYDDHLPEYELPENFVFRYLKFEKSELEAGVEITDEQLEEATQKILGEQDLTPVQSLSHIELRYDGDADRDKAEAEVLAQDIRSRVESGEVSFADMAREYSDDSFTASEGGSLGSYINDIFPEAVQGDLSSLVAGEIYGPAEIEEDSESVHLIYVDTVETPQALDPEVVREEERVKLFTQAVEREQQLLRDSLEDQAWTALALDEVASQYPDKSEQTSASLEPPFRGFLADTADVDSSDLLREGVHGPFEAPEDSLIVLVVEEHTPARFQDLEEVRQEIELSLLEKASKDRLMEIQVQVEDLLEQGHSLLEAVTEVLPDDSPPLLYSEVARSDVVLAREVMDTAFELEVTEVEAEVVVDGEVASEEVAQSLVDASWSFVELEDGESLAGVELEAVIPQNGGFWGSPVGRRTLRDLLRTQRSGSLLQSMADVAREDADVYKAEGVLASTLN